MRSGEQQEAKETTSVTGKPVTKKEEIQEDKVEETTEKETKEKEPQKKPDLPKVEPPKAKEPVKIDPSKVAPKYAKLMAVAKDDFSPLPEHMRNDNVPPVSSVFVERVGPDGTPTTTRDIIKGLNKIQEKILLPDLLGMDYTSTEFPKAVKDFWTEFSIKVPLEPVGKRLNYATYPDTATIDGKIVEYDCPVNLTDYMEYTFAKQNPRVASTPEEQMNKDMYSHVLIDEEIEKSRKREDYGKRAKADREFVLLLDGATDSKEESMSKLDYVIQLIKNPEEFINIQQMTVEDKGEWLRDRKEANPEKFVAIVSDRNLEVKALRSALVERGFIKYEGEYYFYGEDNIGQETGSLDWLKDSRNSAKIKDLKVKLDHSFMLERTQVPD